MNKYPILIGGAPRSGTTALIQLLNSNDSSFISSEENLLKILQTSKKMLSTKERRQENMTNGMRALSIRETLNEENIHKHNFSIESSWPVIKYIYKWHHKKLNTGSELILWGDKLPNYYKELDIIANTPKIRYLHITRNPLDVINSMIRRTEMAKQGKDWWKAITVFEDMLSTWCDAYTAIEKHANKINILHIHYEDLLFNYDDTITAINSFFDSNLVYENILINNKDLHFDRRFLTEELIEKIHESPVVKRYLSKISPL